MIRIEHLAALPMFQDLSPDALEALARCGQERAFRSGTVLFLVGDDPKCWYVVLEGRVRVLRGVGDRQHVIHTEGPGGSLGEVPLFSGGTLPATAIAAERTRCAVFGREALLSLMRNHGPVALVLLRRMAQRVRGLVERVNDRSARSVRARLAAHLLERQRAMTSSTISLGMSQAVLAEELGTVREVVARELRWFVRSGLVARAGRLQFRIVNPAALAQTASG